MAETISGAGILGELDDPTVGHFSNMEMEIPFRVLDREATDMLDMTKAVRLTLRAAQQALTVEGDTEFRSMRVVVRGKSATLPGQRTERQPHGKQRDPECVLYPDRGRRHHPGRTGQDQPDLQGERR